MRHLRRGIGIRNACLGGLTRIIYLVQDKDEGTAGCRRAEAIAAWKLAGVPKRSLHHLNLLPPLRIRDPSRLAATAVELRKIVEKFSPTVVIMPMFEGGHIHHDMANQVVSSILASGSGIRVFEAPEYSPYVSLRWTPHRVLALCARWIFGFVAYYGAPDGIDGRTVWKVRLSADELKLKRRMLATFVSQNGASLAATRCYSDRLVYWVPRDYRGRPFEVEGSFLSFVLLLGRFISNDWAIRLLPVQLGTIGREPAITDLQQELT